MEQDSSKRFLPKDDLWKDEKVPLLDSPEQLRQAGYEDMTRVDRIEFLYRRSLQHQLHGYE